MTLIRRRSARQKALDKIGVSRLIAALGGVAAAALAATIARRRSRATAYEPTGPVPAPTPPPTTPEGSATRYVETQKTGS